MITRAENLSRVGSCKICDMDFMPGGHYDRERLLSVGICPDCDFWMEKWKARDNADVVIANAHYYLVGSTTDKPRGMGSYGKMKITFFDGREVITDSLWSNGDIPELWHPWLYDNATMEFVK